MNTPITDPIYESGDVSPVFIPEKIGIEGSGVDLISAFNALTATLPNANANSGGVASYILIDYIALVDTVTVPGSIIFRTFGIAQDFNQTPAAKRDFL